MIGSFAVTTMLTKNTFVEETRKQYVLVARAKGLSEGVGHAVLSGEQLVDASSGFQEGQPAVYVKLDARGASQIQQSWAEGPRIWRELQFLTISRPGVPFDQADLPPLAKLVPLDVPGASTAVRALIRQFVAAEKPAAPLSDSAIAQMLEEQGIQVARRTVAKYREEIGVLPSNLRRDYK